MSYESIIQAITAPGITPKSPMFINQMKFINTAIQSLNSQNPLSNIEKAILLYHAITAKMPDVAQTILSLRVDVNTELYCQNVVCAKMTPFVKAVISASFEVIDMMLLEGGDLGTVWTTTGTTLYDFCREHIYRIPSIGPILDSKLITFEQNQLEREGITAITVNTFPARSTRHTHLQQAIRESNYVRVKALLRLGAQINDFSRSQAIVKTGLMLAAETGKAPMVSLLLSHKANAYIKTKQGATALDLIKDKPSEQFGEVRKLLVGAVLPDAPREITLRTKQQIQMDFEATAAILEKQLDELNQLRQESKTILQKIDKLNENIQVLKENKAALKKELDTATTKELLQQMDLEIAQSKYTLEQQERERAALQNSLMQLENLQESPASSNPGNHSALQLPAANNTRFEETNVNNSAQQIAVHSDASIASAGQAQNQEPLPQPTEDEPKRPLDGDETMLPGKKRLKTAEEPNPNSFFNRQLVVSEQEPNDDKPNQDDDANEFVLDFNPDDLMDPNCLFKTYE